MIRLRHACILAAPTWLALTGCVGSSRWPRLTEGARYEVHNPTPCRAEVYTATDDNVTRQYLGAVPSGGRVVITVPPRAEGTRVAAMALYRDGTNCDVGSRIRVRRVGQ
jgi:hypothetical protein